MKSKIKYLLCTVFLLIMPVCNLLAKVEPTYDYRGKEMNVVYIVSIVLLIVRVAVPILLIVMGSIGLIQAMVSNDDRETKAAIRRLVTKVIIAIVIFILPTAVALVMKLISFDSTWSKYANCLARPASCKVEIWKK